ncbi:MAG: hypothetical protein EOM64_03330 [Erysipelotrichia bacterium]|nr:hypothetical protein [Erysipelotrichia bacterium]
MTTILMGLQGTVLIYLLLGVLLKKCHLIKPQDTIFLSNLILDFILPTNIFYSCISSFTAEKFVFCLAILLMAVFVEVSIFMITKIKNKLYSESEMKVVQYGLLVSNGGLIGTPIIEGLFGAVGVLYANIFLIPTRIMAYTSGENLFNPQKKENLTAVLRGIIRNKVIMSMVCGIAIALLSIPIPTFAVNALQNIARCMSPMSLILVGSLLVEKFRFDISEFSKIIVLCIARQIVLPVGMIGLFKIFPMDYSIMLTAILLIGMPIGSTCAIFASKYQSEVEFASKSVMVSTISSTLSLVLIAYISEILL